MAMSDYIKAFIVMVLLNIAGLFVIGFGLGVLMALTGNPNSVDTIDEMAWFNILVLVSWAFIGFFAFKFSVDKFLFKYR